MEENLGVLVSKFVSERVDNPNPRGIDTWSQLVYAALFSVGFVVWSSIATNCSSESEMNGQLNTLIDDIAEDAKVWINHKTQEVLKISDLNIMVNSAPEIKFHLGAMFAEAIEAVNQHKLSLELARSHACFVHLQANLRKLILISKIQLDIKDVLTKGLSGCDAMVGELQNAIKSKHISLRNRTFP